MRISERIIAVYLMQRFVRMSRILLPAFIELKSKKNPTKFEEGRIKGIEEVYQNFNADPNASKILINSNILELIQKIYFRIMKDEGFDSKGLFQYDQFIEECDRLIVTWDRQLLN